MKAVRRMLRFYPPRNVETTDEYVAGLVAVLVDKPIDIVEQFGSPHMGIATVCKFTPTLAEVHAWLSPRVNHYYAMLDARDAERRQLEHVEEPIPPEERKHRAQMLKDLARTIRETVKAKCVGRPIDFTKTQQGHSLKQLFSTDLTTGKTRA